MLKKSTALTYATCSDLPDDVVAIANNSCAEADSLTRSTSC